MPTEDGVLSLLSTCCTGSRDHIEVKLPNQFGGTWRFDPVRTLGAAFEIHRQLLELLAVFQHPRGQHMAFGVLEVQEDATQPWANNFEVVGGLFALGVAVDAARLLPEAAWTDPTMPRVCVKPAALHGDSAARSGILEKLRVHTDDLDNFSPPVGDTPKKKEGDNMAAATAEKNATAEIEKELQRLIIERSGTKLMLPLGLSHDTAIEALKRAKAADEQIVQIVEPFECMVPEGALALFHTLNDLYGFVGLMETPGRMPWDPKNPPVLLNVQTGPTTRVTIPWGRFSVPGVDGFIETGIRWHEDVPYFQLTAAVRGHSRPEINRLVSAIRARKDNIYAGHAIRVAFPSMEDASSMEDFFPQFTTLPSISRSDLVFAEDVAEIVEVALFTPIEKTAFCRENRIPLKRGILLEGPYGVGKTLTANVAAKLCELHGWTFVQLREVKDLSRAYAFALQHQPAMVFCEDIDELLQDEDGRDDEINAILNSVDGIESKDAEIITLFTTNDVGGITKAMLRPGRIDTVIPVRPPDAAAARKLVTLYAGDTLAPDEDLLAAGALLAGHNAAVVREVVNRSKLGAVRRITGPGQRLTLIARDIEIAARQMEAHSKLLDEPEDDKRCDLEKAADRLGAHILDGMTGRRAREENHSYPGLARAVAGATLAHPAE